MEYGKLQKKTVEFKHHIIQYLDKKVLDQTTQSRLLTEVRFIFLALQIALASSKVLTYGDAKLQSDKK